MRNEVAIALLACTLCACQTKVEHPRGEKMLPTLKGAVVATIDGRKITAAEAEQFAEMHEDASLDTLTRREARANAALDSGADVSFDRKRAMVNALLADEIEAKIGPEDVPKKAMDEARAAVAAELHGFAGYEVTSIRVASPELLQKGAKLPPARFQELQQKVFAAAQRLYDAVPQTNATDAIETLKWDWLDPELRVERQVDVKVLDAHDPRDPPRGWVRAQRLALELADLHDGDRSSLFKPGTVPVFVVRKGVIEPEAHSESEIDAEARKRAVAKLRRKHLDDLLDRLRSSTTIAMHPELLEESE